MSTDIRKILWWWANGMKEPIADILAKEVKEEEISYCNCCGVIRINGVGECYTDCIWYDGDLPPDANPH